MVGCCAADARSCSSPRAHARSAHITSLFSGVSCWYDDAPGLSRCSGASGCRGLLPAYLLTECSLLLMHNRRRSVTRSHDAQGVGLATDAAPYLRAPVAALARAAKPGRPFARDHPGYPGRPGLFPSALLDLFSEFRDGFPALPLGAGQPDLCFVLFEQEFLHQPVVIFQPCR